jgi:hypothetical protein
MSKTLFVQVDAKAVERDLWELLNTDEMSLLMDVDNENAQDYGHGITGQEYLLKAIICAHVYRTLDGFKWRNVDKPSLERSKFGAEVEFTTKADAMLWKLSQE